MAAGGAAGIAGGGAGFPGVPACPGGGGLSASLAAAVVAREEGAPLNRSGSSAVREICVTVFLTSERYEASLPGLQG